MPNDGSLSGRPAIEKSLYDLAKEAWAARRTLPSHDFLLSPETLPRVSSGKPLSSIVEALYTHARIWAPGFEVPFGVPKVCYARDLVSGGQFRVDTDGYPSIDVGTQLAPRRAAVLTILAHEACHHVLEMSGIRGSSREETERLTDLATFVCGFGRLVLEGYSQAWQTPSGWTRVHIGYLSAAEYEFAYQWVLRVQGLPDDLPNSGQVERGSRPTWLQRFLGWIAGGNAKTANDARQPPRRPLLPEILDPIQERCRYAKSLLDGDVERLERLIEYEKRRLGTDDKLAALDAVIETLDRDRR